jgi:hypothetical protein
MADEYTDIVNRYGVIFARIPDLAILDDAGHPVNILDYEPAELQILPTIYTLDRGGRVSSEGNVIATHYFQLHRLCLKWAENATTEAELRPWINAIIQGVEEDCNLQGYIDRGMAQITDWTSVFVGIGGTIYRAIDFLSDTWTKRARVPRLF